MSWLAGIPWDTLSPDGKSNGGPPATFTPAPVPVSSVADSWSLGQDVYGLLFGVPTPTQVQALGDEAAKNVAQAGGSIADQQAAKQLVMGQIKPATKAFDQNNPLSNVLQRGWDAASGTADPADVVSQGFLDILPDWMFDGSGAINWTKIGLVVLVAVILIIVLIKV